MRRCPLFRVPFIGSGTVANYTPVLYVVQTLVSSLERSRAAMANDLAAVSTQNVELTEKVNTIPHLTNKLQVYTLHGHFE